MDWNRLVLIAGECVVVVTLGILVGLGHDGAVTDALLIVSGAIAGTGAYGMVKKV